LLTGLGKLATVSSSPGKTTLINHFLINANPKDQSGGWFLVDLPGYGYAKRSQKQRAQWQQMLAGYFQERPNLQTVFVLIDSRLSPQKIDLEFLVQLGGWGVPFNLIFTKSDKSTQSVTAKNVRSFIDRMKADWEYIPAHFITSTVKRTGRREILQFIAELNAAAADN
jgi:GTP-binding protein